MTTAATMQNLEILYYLLAILGFIGGTFITVVSITSRMRKYVDQSVANMQRDLASQMDKSTKEARDALEKVERMAINRRASEDHLIGEMRVDLSNLKSQVSAHSARFGMLEDLLTEVRGDIKTLLGRKDQ